MQDIKKSVRCQTVFKKEVIPRREADQIFEWLAKNIKWEEGVRSRKGFTRKAKPFCLGLMPNLDKVILKTLKAMTKQEYEISHIYINYYENGEMWCPNHNHPGTHQLVLSLGCPRKLNVAKKEYLMENGDAILFGSALHGVPKEPGLMKGRISIATFMVPIEKKVRDVVPFYNEEEKAIQEAIYLSLLEQ